MPRFSIPILATILIAALVFIVSGRSDNEQKEEPEFPLAGSARSMPEAKVGLEVEEADTSTGGETHRKPDCPKKERGEMRIGGFERPDRGAVPEYGIIQPSESGRDGVCSRRILVDTRARGEAGLTLITRDIKARYAGYDTVSIEFTDSTATLAYTGGAVIFNTTDGALYAGYIYGPPNNRGYITRAAD